jgi:hypothetical protein
MVQGLGYIIFPLTYDLRSIAGYEDYFDDYQEGTETWMHQPSGGCYDVGFKSTNYTAGRRLKGLFAF